MKTFAHIPKRHITRVPYRSSATSFAYAAVPLVHSDRDTGRVFLVPANQTTVVYHG